jgi:hypothetical protein
MFPDQNKELFSDDSKKWLENNNGGAEDERLLIDHKGMNFMHNV